MNADMWILVGLVATVLVWCFVSDALWMRKLRKVKRTKQPPIPRSRNPAIDRAHEEVMQDHGYAIWCNGQIPDPAHYAAIKSAEASKH